jgi:hypothetical protein
MARQRVVLALLAAGLLAILATIVGTRIGPESASAQDQNMEGSWMLATTFPDGRQTMGLATHNGNGTYVISTSNPRLTAGHGVWVSTGNREFGTTWVALRFDESGAVVGTQKVRGQLTLDATGDSFSSRSQIEFLDRAGNVVGSGSATTQGRRLRVEPAQ